jgi:hypothetical protein
LVATIPGTSHNDTGVSRGQSGTSYFYRVCASNASGSCLSPSSNIALGTAYSFYEPQLYSYADCPAPAATI